MKVLVQWATWVPSGWVEIDASDWESLPTRPDPTSSDVADGQPGYINRVCVQGVEHTADHYAVEPLEGGGCKVYTWSDAPPRDGRPGYVEGTRYARVWTFEPLAQDPNLGGAYNTVQSQEVFAEQSVIDFYDSIGGLPGGATLRPWDEFVPPTDIARHGIWLPDRLYQQHEDTRPIRGWREWAEHLSPEERDASGHLLDQRRQGRYNVPKGTRTYYHDTAATASPLHTATFEQTLQTSPTGAVSQQSDNFSGNEDRIEWVASTPPNEPNSAAWPTGDYRCQLDVTSAGGDLVFGLLTLGLSAGHFARVTSDLLVHSETKTQQQAAFAGSGLHLATTGSVSWAAGVASNRFEIAIAVQRAANHGNQSITLQLGESDDFADGPWPAAAAPNTNALDRRTPMGVLRGVGRGL